jgi:hypothetical protein
MPTISSVIAAGVEKSVTLKKKIAAAANIKITPPIRREFLITISFLGSITIGAERP